MKKQLEHYLYTHIPITQAMGIQVEEATLEKIVLFAPFIDNINHQKTVFGGSLHAVSTLACWSLIHVNLQQEPIQIVVSHSDTSFKAPVTTDFYAVCNFPEQDTWNRFLNMLKTKGKGRLSLRSTIHEDDKLCVDYQGTFVVWY